MSTQTAVVVIGKGHAQTVTTEHARRLIALMLRTDEPWQTREQVKK